jgi:Xaa-Pro aminopeptidase
MKDRLQRLRALLSGSDFPALLVTHPVNVTYLTGFTGTTGYALVTGKNAYLLTDFRYLEQAREEAALFELVDVTRAVWEKTGKILEGEGVRTLALEAEHLTVETFRKISAELPDSVTLLPEASPVGMMRRIKSREEIQAIEAAVKLADEAFAHILTFLAPGVREVEAALQLEYFMRRKGAKKVSFDLIVASGKRSALPHGVAGEKRLEPGDAVVLDLGCILNGYCSDLSRTVFIQSVSHEQKQVYQAVLDAQRAAFDGIHAGMNGREADAAARNLLAGRGLAEFFGHGLGHGLGREIHEGPRLSPAADEMLEAGMVVTVEPGVYLEGRFGVRIEDVVVVEEGGCRNLTSSTKDLLCL